MVQLFMLEKEFLITILHIADAALLKGSDYGGVTGKDGKRTQRPGQGYQGNGGADKSAFRAQDMETDTHLAAASMASPFLMASSMVPTLRKACSGR